MAARTTLASKGTVIPDDVLAHLSPAEHEHINVHGHIDFGAVRPPRPGTLRPLRPPTRQP